MRRPPRSGCLGSGFPEEYGGVAADQFMKIVASQELARAGAGGVGASLMSHTIGSPPIARAARPEIKARVLPRGAVGQEDLRAGDHRAERRLRCRQFAHQGAARRRPLRRQRREDVYHLGHAGGLSDRCGAHGRRGAGGVSLLLIEGDTPGLSRTKLKKMGWWASDTATLHFDDCRVPAENLIGEEGQGFKIIMQNFNSERMGMAAGCTAYARVCLDEAIAYAKERKTFGKPIAQHQVIRHKLVDMAQKVAASQAMLEMLAWRLEQGESPVAEICMMKNQATQTMAFCASEAVQIFGGAGFMRGIKVERIYREVKVNAIGGGTEEIMKDLAPADGVVIALSPRRTSSGAMRQRRSRNRGKQAMSAFRARRFASAPE